MLLDVKESNCVIVKKLDAIKDENDMRYRELKTEVGEISSTVKAVDQRVTLVDDKVEDNKKEISKCLKLINWMNQTKLISQVEVSGMKIPESQCDLKEAVLNAFSSIYIKVEPNKINFAAHKKIPIKKDAKEMIDIVTVEFSDLKTKLQVMKDKKKAKESKNIYLNDALTPDNRALIGKVKAIAKKKHFFVFMRGSKIKIKKNDEIYKTIECEDDLIAVNDWSANEKRASNSDTVL